MLRYIAMLLVPAALFLVSPTPASAQWQGPWRGQGWNANQGDALVGDYVNRSNGGMCSVYRQGRGYVFVNENGSRARFVFTAPGRLEQVGGSWDPSVVVSVLRGRNGPPTLRFDSANAAPGFWVPAD